MSIIIQKFPKFKSFLETPTQAKSDEVAKSNEFIKIITLRDNEFHDLVNHVAIKRKEKQPKESEIIGRLIDYIMISREILEDPVEKLSNFHWVNKKK